MEEFGENFEKKLRTNGVLYFRNIFEKKKMLCA